MDDSEFLRSKSDSCQRQIATYDLRVALKALIKMGRWRLSTHFSIFLFTKTEDRSLVGLVRLDIHKKVRLGKFE